MTAVRGLIVQLDTAIRGVEAGAKHKSACITLVGSMKGTGVRPQRVGDTKDGKPIYLLNVEQARRLLDRAEEAEAARESS
jgi:hypothetical protein